MEANRIRINTVIFSIIAIAAIEVAARWFINWSRVAPLTALGLARVVEIIFLLTLVKTREGRLTAIGLTSSNVYRRVKKGLLWSVSFGIAAGIVLVIIYFLGFNWIVLFQMQQPAKGRELIIFFLVGAFIGPIAEEIFFRGILYGFFRKWGIPTAIILSTLLFVLPHTSGGTIPGTQIIGGILFAVAYEIEKNLLVPIMIHSLGNMAIFTLTLII
jgi:membrane protease YdiL (CAAX protease family)